VSSRELTLQHVQNLLRGGLDPARSTARRAFLGPGAGMCQRVPAGDFSHALIRDVGERGQRLTEVTDRERLRVGILSSPGHGLAGGASTDAPYEPGLVAY
jgi:hypothetical protein